MGDPKRGRSWGRRCSEPVELLVRLRRWMILLRPWEELILDILEVDLAKYPSYGTQVVVRV